MLPIRPQLVLLDGWEEALYAEGQDMYQTLPVVRSQDEERRVISRWTPTYEERQMVMRGEDLFLTILTLGEPLQPVLLAVGAPVLTPVVPAPLRQEAIRDTLKAAVESSSDPTSLDVVGTESGKVALPLKLG